MVTREIQIGQHTLSIETGKLAKQADGSAIIRYGDSMVLVTACRSATARVGIDFLPLTVDYREYTYASGRIPGGFFKREGKPAEKEVLTSRLIDRPSYGSTRLARCDTRLSIRLISSMQSCVRKCMSPSRIGSPRSSVSATPRNQDFIW